MNDDVLSFDGLEVSITSEPSSSSLDKLAAGLEAYNERVTGGDRAVPIAVIAQRGELLIGGASGYTQWGWLFIEYLWVSDEARGEGLGAHLLQRAETSARDRGCCGVWLDTFSFQAPEYYKRFGYRQFGRLDDYPVGGARHFLWKPLVAHAAGPLPHERLGTLRRHLNLRKRLSQLRRRRGT